MKKILLVALALCLSYGFAYSCLFNHSINLTTKMQNFETDSFTTKNGKSLKITFFKHASLLIEYAGKKFFIDPVSDYADFTQQPKADYILITHEHHDHFDTKAIGYRNSGYKNYCQSELPEDAGQRTSHEKW